MTVAVMGNPKALCVSTSLKIHNSRRKLTNFDIFPLFHIASQSTAATKIDSANNEHTINEDVFRLIEHGNSQELRKLLN